MDAPCLRNRYVHVSWDTGGSDHPNTGFLAPSATPMSMNGPTIYKRFLTILTRRFTVIAGGSGVT